MFTATCASGWALSRGAWAGTRRSRHNAALFIENKRTICPSRPDAVLSNEAATSLGLRGGSRRGPIVTPRAIYRTALHASQSQALSVHDFRVLLYRTVVPET